MKSTEAITNSEDIIDSRDVIARIEYLQSELENYIQIIIDEGDL